MTIFSGASYFFFVAITVSLFFVLPTRFRHAVLFISGVIFYYYFAGLWVLLFFSELFISRFYRKGSWACYLGAIQALVVLFIFKYGNFVESNIRDVFGLSNSPHWSPVLIVLPLAISFFTFEFVHFAVDSYTGKIQERHWTKYGSFIFFFPTLVAGPIKRYQDFVPKVETAKFDTDHFTAGITRIMIGFFKKFVIADSFAQWTKFLNPEFVSDLSGVWLWQSVIAYGFRIFFDFSGYADIAIGTAMLFGIVVPENFQRPYLSTNISDFWKRWHISLYRWLVDYIFIPLGGSRGGTWKTCRNIMIVTTASGLWHGASWNFLLWGWYHGIFLCIFHLLHREESSHPIPQSKLRKAFAFALTFIVVMFGWTFFALRSQDIPLAVQKMFFLK
jgi:alginate O-acetyltransferase complex protein AlgI